MVTNKQQISEPSEFLEFNGRTITIQGKELNIVYSNKLILKNGAPSNAWAQIASGNCCAPTILNGDYVLVAGTIAPVDGDWVIFEHPVKGQYLQQFHSRDGVQWASSRHGKMSLDSWRVEAIVFMVARQSYQTQFIDGKEYISIPVIDLGPLKPIS